MEEAQRKRMEEAQHKLKVVAEAGDIDGLYSTIQQEPDILEHIDKIPFVDTPLHTAVSAGCTHFAIEIISLKPSFGRKLNGQGLSPLHLALRNGNSEIVKWLITFDKDLIRVKGRERITPLHYVAEANEIDLLAEFLCACPTSIEDLTIRGETAVHVAVKNFKLPAFEVLLGWILFSGNEHVLNNTDEEGNTVLHTAVSTSHDEIVKLLVAQYKVKLNEKNLEGLTALDIAKGLAPSDSNSKIVKVLRLGGASESSSLPSDYTSLAKSFRSRHRGRGVILNARDMTMEMRNVLLVVAVLITTATYQAILSPPGGGVLFEGSHTNGNSSTIIDLPSNNTTAPSPAATTNPFKRILFKNGGIAFTVKTFFVFFYSLNTLAFIYSVILIIVVMPWSNFSVVLQCCLLYLTLSYGVSFFVLAPSLEYAMAFLLVPLILPTWAYYLQLRTNVPIIGSLRRKIRVFRPI